MKHLTCFSLLTLSIMMTGCHPTNPKQPKSPSSCVCSGGNPSVWFCTNKLDPLNGKSCNIGDGRFPVHGSAPEYIPTP